MKKLTKVFALAVALSLPVVGSGVVSDTNIVFAQSTDRYELGVDTGNGAYTVKTVNLGQNEDLKNRSLKAIRDIRAKAWDDNVAYIPLSGSSNLKGKTIQEVAKSAGLTTKDAYINALTWSTELEKISTQRAFEQIFTGMSHTRPDGRDSFSAVTSKDVKHHGENVAYTGGYNITPEESFKVWTTMRIGNRPSEYEDLIANNGKRTGVNGHLHSILNPEYKHVSYAQVNIYDPAKGMTIGYSASHFSWGIPGNSEASLNLVGPTNLYIGKAPANPKPVTPEPEKPITPEPEKPVTPEPEKPITPEPEKPVNPEPEKPVNPEPEKPVNPEPEKPVNPEPEKPVNPEPEKPVNPEPEKPVNPEPEKPVNPEPEKPVNPEPEKPVNPEPEKPVNPEPEKPVTPEPEKPVNPEPEKPVNPEPEKPVNPQPEQPINPGPITPGPHKPETLVPASQPNLNDLIKWPVNPQPRVTYPSYRNDSYYRDLWAYHTEEVALNTRMSESKEEVKKEEEKKEAKATTITATQRQQLEVAVRNAKVSINAAEFLLQTTPKTIAKVKGQLLELVAKNKALIERAELILNN